MGSKSKGQIGMIGYGELGIQLENLLAEYEPACLITHFDDNNSIHSFDEYKINIRQYLWLIGIGYKHLERRVEIINEIKKEGGQLKSIIHNSSFVSPKAIIQEGTICYPMCNIDKGVKIESGTLLNNSVVVSHDSIIGKGSYISPGVVISGNVQIEEGCFIGARTVISNGIKIGSFSRIGVGSVITKNIPKKSWVIGNPQRILDQPFNF